MLPLKAKEFPALGICEVLIQINAWSTCGEARAMGESVLREMKPKLRRDAKKGSEK